MRHLLWIPALLGAVALCASEEPPRVTDVRFDPRVQPLAQEAIDRLVTVKRNAPLSGADVRESIRRLFQSGRYENIEAEAGKAP